MPGTNSFFPRKKAGDSIPHEDWNDISKQVVALSNIGDGGNVIATGAGMFRRPAKQARGTAAVDILPYIITQETDDPYIDTGGPLDILSRVAIYRTSHEYEIEPYEMRYGFKAQPAIRDGLTWTYEDDPSEEVFINSDGLGGVCFTGQHCFASEVDGELTWISGPSGHFFENCQAAENINVGDTGEVFITQAIGGNSYEHIVMAKNKTGTTVFSETNISLLFDDHVQEFFIVLPECAT